AAPLAPLHENVDVLAGEELQPLARGQFQVKHGDVPDGPLDPFHAARQRADREILCSGALADLEDDVAARARAAGEGFAGGTLRRMQRPLLVVAELELARSQPPLARAASSIAAAIRQADVLLERALEDGVAGRDGERVAARLEANLVPGRGGIGQSGQR